MRRRKSNARPSSKNPYPTQFSPEQTEVLKDVLAEFQTQTEDTMAMVLTKAFRSAKTSAVAQFKLMRPAADPAMIEGFEHGVEACIEAMHEMIKQARNVKVKI